MFFLVPPAGTPLSSAEVLRILKSWLKGDDAGDSFKAAIRAATGVRHCFLFNSGRASLLFALRSLSKFAGAGRNEVIIPAYTCPSVASAMAMAGLKIRLVDVVPLTLDYDYEKLQRTDFSRVLAIVGCNLFGILSDWDRLRGIARDKKVFLIDDAAQSMGCTYGGRPSGTMGDIGFYSLDRGKNLSTYTGGILITDRDDIAALIEEDMKILKRPGFWKDILALFQIVLYAVFLRPRLYWFPSMLPNMRLGWGKEVTYFPEYFIPGRLPRIQESAGVLLLPRLESLSAGRITKSQAMAKEIVLSRKIEIPGFDDDKSRNYLRLPLLFPDRKSRDRALKEIVKQGIQASTMYMSTIRQIAGIEKYLATPVTEFPGAEQVLDRLLTLPTHPYMDEKSMKRAVSTVMAET